MGQLPAVGKPLKAPAMHKYMAGAFLSVQTQNPRASRLDLENGLLIDDPQGQWLGPRRTELAQIFQHTTRIEGYQAVAGAGGLSAGGRQVSAAGQPGADQALLYRIL